MEEIPISYTDHRASEADQMKFPGSSLMTTETMLLPYDYQSFISSEFFHHMCLASGGSQFVSNSSSSMLLDSDVISSDVVVATDGGTANDCYQVQADHYSVQERDEMDTITIKSKILGHPLFPRMLRAYAECQKFTGELSETRFTDEMEPWINEFSSVLGTDPELDEFMGTYCEMLEKHTEVLCNTFMGVTSFLNSMELQLSDLCGSLSTTSLYGIDVEEPINPSPEEEQPTVRADDNQTSTHNDRAAATDLKMNILSKFGCAHLKNLKHEFSKRTKKKKGKLPCEARQVLVNWWCSHHNWPYPTETDKLELTRMTGLLPKQINNWFINQRKRHWKTSAETLQYSWVTNNVSTGSDLYFGDEEFDAA